MKLMALRDAYAEALIELGNINPNVVVLDADVSSSTRTARFGKVFPDRFLQQCFLHNQRHSTLHLLLIPLSLWQLIHW